MINAPDTSIAHAHIESAMASLGTILGELRTQRDEIIRTAESGGIHGIETARADTFAEEAMEHLDEDERDEIVRGTIRGWLKRNHADYRIIQHRIEKFGRIMGEMRGIEQAIDPNP